MNRLGFFTRLLLAFLLVIMVAGVVLYTVGNALGPTLLRQHLESMGLSNYSDSVVVRTMLTDLEVAYRDALTRSLIWAVVAAFAIGGSLSFFITHRIAGPLNRMRNATRRIAKGEYSERVPYSGPVEISDLAADFNSMASALASAETQRSELIRNLAHEFRTPLMNLRGYIEGVEDDIFELNPETIQATKRQLERLERLMTDLSLLSRVDAKQESVHIERHNLETICQASVAVVKPQFVSKGVTLICKPFDTPLWVMADAGRTEQVLVNLLTNALKHTQASGTVTLRASSDAHVVTLHVEDTGNGIPKDALAHVFTRFYRADNQQNNNTGSGIGLTIAQYFIQAQGGQIFVESTLNQGSHFWFTLQRA